MSVVASSSEEFYEYRETFSQPIDRYALKNSNSDWHTVKQPLADSTLKGHLGQYHWVGCLARWYPTYGIFDFDNVSREEVQDKRAEMGFHVGNSMLFTSESPDSYHLLFRPTYKGKPATAKLLQNIIGPSAKANGVEIFPHPEKTIRLPFGLKQIPLDYEYHHLTNWVDLLYWFQKLDEFPLENWPQHQTFFEFQPREPTNSGIIKSAYQEGLEYRAHGLQAPSTRERAQFCIIYALWRQNVAPVDAFRITWSWIRTKHNGFSKDFLRNPSAVKAHIKRQVARIYNYYHLESCYPDNSHKLFHGYITKPDMEQIIRISGGNIPRSRFLFHLVKYAYPRHHRQFMGVHTDVLRSWAKAQTVTIYLNELEAQGVLKRGAAYSVGRFSKAIDIKWNFGGSSDAVLYEGRVLDSFKGTIRLIYEPSDLRELLEASGAERTTALKATQRVYGV